MSHNDAEELSKLVERVRAGDERAWSELIRRLERLVMGIAIGQYGLNRQCAEDIAQNVWVKIFRRIGDIREPAALPGWVRVATQRECLSLIHRSPQRREVATLIDERWDVTDPDDASALELAEAAAVLHAAVQRLDDQYRTLVELLFADEKQSYEAISAQTGRPVSSIGPRRQRALGRLRQDPEIQALKSA